MAWTTPRTWTTSETVTAAMMNEQIRDNANYIKSHIDAVTNVHGLGASVNVLGDRTSAAAFVQHGTVSATNAGVAVTFAVAFTTLLGVWLTGTHASMYGVAVVSASTTGFTAYINSALAVTCNWLALGT